MGIGFKESKLGFLFKVGPVPTFLLMLFLFPRMGIALLPVAAGASLSPGGCQNEFAQRHLEPGEGGKVVVGGGGGLHFSKKFGGGFGLVWFL